MLFVLTLSMTFFSAAFLNVFLARIRWSIRRKTNDRRLEITVAFSRTVSQSSISTSTKPNFGFIAFVSKNSRPTRPTVTDNFKSSFFTCRPYSSTVTVPNPVAVNDPSRMNAANALPRTVKLQLLSPFSSIAIKFSSLLACSGSKITFWNNNYINN